MKRMIALSGLGLLAYLIFLIALLPATQVWRLAAEPLAAQLPQLHLAGIDGRIWQGRAASLAWQAQSLGQLEWKLKPWPLLGRRAEVQLALQDQHAHLQGRVKAPLDGAAPIRITQLQGRFPIQQASRFVAYLPVAVDGTVSLNLPDVQLDTQGRPVGLNGQVVWHQAVISFTEPMALGDLRAELHTDENGIIHGEIRDTGGPLSIQAQLQLQPDGQYRFSGYVAPGDGAGPALQQALGWLGRPDNQGRYRVNYTGKL